jgi:hypothetical protein
MTVDFVKKCGTVQLALQAKCEVICHRAYKVGKPVKKEMLFFIHFFILFFSLAFPNYFRIVVTNEAFLRRPFILVPNTFGKLGQTHSGTRDKTWPLVISGLPSSSSYPCKNNSNARRRASILMFVAL